MAKLLLIAPTCDGEDVGEAWVAHQWARRLAERHELTLLTYHKRGRRPARAQLPGVEVVEWTEPPLLGRAERLNSMLKPGYLPFFFQARSWIARSLGRGERFDVIHQPVPVAMRYPSPGTGFNIPLVIGPVGGGLDSPPAFAEEEGSAPWFTRLRSFDRFRLARDPVLRRTYAGADCVLGIADYVRELLAPVPLRRFEVMSETGLDAVPAFIDRRTRVGPVRLLHVGRLVRTKGARDLIRAVALLPDLPLHLDIVGEGPEREPCAALIDELGLQDRVTLQGWKNRDEVAAFYRDADIFAFPSYREPGGNVALEAMGFSLPLIVVDRGGPGSATSAACATRLPLSTPADLSRDLSTAIRTLATDQGLRCEMGRAAHAHVTATALWSAKLDRMDEIYAELIAGRRRSEAANVAPLPGIMREIAG